MGAARVSLRVTLVESLGQAVGSILGNPLRSSLAALAMAVAVATTAAVQTGLNALERSARQASARAFGSDTFVLTRIATGSLSRREIADRLQRNPLIARSDVRFLDRVAGDRVRYAATAQRSGDISAGSRTFENGTITGAEASLADIRDVGVQFGRFLTPEEDVAGAQVVVIGRLVADTLFPTGEVLGQAIRIAGRSFRVVGVQAPQGTGAAVALDRYVWMPLTAFERVFGGSGSLQVFAKAPDEGTTSDAEDRARASMRARRHLGPAAPDTFDLVTPEASRTFVSAITERIGAAGPPISLMALIAAVVVVTNTTLVSVTQRTREIGVRRALGARRANIVMETLIESSLIALAGGVAGLSVAAGVLQLLAGPAGLSLGLSGSVTVGSLAAAASSGLVAGWYPARRAIGVDVITALRQE